MLRCQSANENKKPEVDLEQMDPFNVARHSLVMDAAKCETREVPKRTEMKMTVPSHR